MDWGLPLDGIFGGDFCTTMPFCEKRVTRWPSICHNLLSMDVPGTPSPTRMTWKLVPIVPYFRSFVMVGILPWIDTKKKYKKVRWIPSRFPKWLVEHEHSASLCITWNEIKNSKWFAEMSVISCYFGSKKSVSRRLSNLQFFSKTATSVERFSLAPPSLVQVKSPGMGMDDKYDKYVAVSK